MSSDYYIKHKLSNLISISKIVTIHYYELDKNYRYDGESHNFWEMVYVDSGSVLIDANDKLVRLNQGETIFHKPNEFHTLNADKQSAANVFVISFVCSSKAMDFFKGKTMSVPAKLKRYISTIIDEYSHTFNSMSSTDKKLEMKENPPIGSQQLIRTHLEQFLIMLIRIGQTRNTPPAFLTGESMENYLVSQVMQIIEDNVYGKISVDHICSELSYSRAYIAKVFKEASGHTVLKHILMRKIKEAKKLIREEKYNFTQISDMLAFDNPHYFSRVFKRCTNMTPTQYKKSVRTP